MDLKIDPQSLREITAKAILESLTAEAREGLVKQAIIALLTTSPHYPHTSPLQRAFNDAIVQIATELAREHIQNNPIIKEEIRQVMIATLGKIVATNPTIRRAAASAIERAIETEFKTSNDD